MKRIVPLLMSLVFALDSFAEPPSTPPPNAAPARTGFRLVFQSYDYGPPGEKNMTFQINTVDVRQPSEFLKIGDTIPGTKLKLLKFEQKLQDFRNVAGEADFSELTVIHTETKETTVMVLGKMVNLPSARRD